jgi:hypothetical protein
MRYKVGDIVRYREDNAYLHRSDLSLVGMVVELYHDVIEGNEDKKLLVKIQLFDQTNAVPIREIEITNKRWEVLNG